MRKQKAKKSKERWHKAEYSSAAREKLFTINGLPIGGSGSGKTRYFFKPVLIQPTSQDQPEQEAGG